MKIFTIGHSTTDFEQFCDTLNYYGIEKLIDVRSHPGSRYVPHFNKEFLSIELKKLQFDYLHLTKLGGRRKSKYESDYTLVNGWRNQSFRNYASYTLTDEYSEGIQQLINEASTKVVCIMCAESVPWRCHRLIISNTLVNMGIEVIHIINKNQTTVHQLNKYGASVQYQNGKIIYPKL